MSLRARQRLVFRVARLQVSELLCFTALIGISVLASSMRSYGQTYTSSLTGVVNDP